MFESLLAGARKPGWDGKGINIEGWDGVTFTKSAGATMNEDSVSFSGADALDWLRIPDEGTPDLESSQYSTRVDVVFRFDQYYTVTDTARLRIVHRYRQGADPTSWGLSVNGQRKVVFTYNSISTTYDPVLEFGEVYKLSIDRINGVWSVYLNDELLGTANFAGDRVSTHDWVFGSYLTTADGIVGTTLSGRARWVLLGVMVRKI